MSAVPAVVIGAGTAGLAVSRHLQLAGVEHLVLERGRIAETWKSQRWDSFRLNTPNSLNALPGTPFPGDPDGFGTAAELAAFLDGYVTEHGLPVHQGVTVASVTVNDAGFSVKTDSPDLGALSAGAVIAATGGQNRSRTPPLATRIPAGVVQRHADRYRNPGELPSGAVLVVGSAQTGCQIAEDLMAAGRTTYLSVSRVGRARRRYRGRDMLSWLDVCGVFDQRPADLPDPAAVTAAQPQISGVGPRGHTVSLQGLSRRGATLLGRLVDVDGSRLRFDDSVADCIAFGDEASARFRAIVDDYLIGLGAQGGAIEDDPDDEDCEDPAGLQGPESVDASNLGAVIWATGFDGDFSWLQVPVLDERGRPVHDDGIALEPGVFFAGLPWLRRRRSGIIPGVDGDGAWIAAAVAAHLGA